jgi:hypothetical protein
MEIEKNVLGRRQIFFIIFPWHFIFWRHQAGRKSVPEKKKEITGGDDNDDDYDNNNLHNNDKDQHQK